MASITGATAIVTIMIPGLFSSPQQLQGFAVDDVFTTNELESAEVMMGVDGVLSAGFVYVPVEQNFRLQADSPSTFIFDTWWATQQQIQDLFYAQGVTILKPIGKKWAMTKGVLRRYKPTPDAKRLLQPQQFGITWQSILPAAA
jgi:hypothetical protein